MTKYVILSKKNWVEFIATMVADWIKRNIVIDDLEYLKIKLGIEVILINLLKGTVIYGLAFVLNTFYLTLILHTSYLFLRVKSHGLHAKTSLNCSTISIVLFVLLPYFSRHFIFSNHFIIISFMVSFLCLNRYAPADTEKQPLINRQRREKLRKQSLIHCLILFFITLMIKNPDIKKMITLGILSQIIFTLPLTYKILKRSYNNYKKYTETFDE